VPRIRSRATWLLSSWLCGVALAQTPSDLNGVWQLISPVPAQIKTVGGREPPLNEHGQAIYAQHRAAYQAGDRSFDAAANGCGDPGMPRIMMMSDRFEIVQDADRVVTLFARGNRFRVVELKRSLDPVDLFYFGNPNGRWDHSELVVESTDFRENTFIDAAGMPHSDAMTLIERYRLSKGGKELTDQITISDSKTFEHPWTLLMRYRKLPPHTQLLPAHAQVNCGPLPPEGSSLGGG
jgi:hypothetical protein